MDIQTIFEQLETATDFELYRIKSAIEKVLEDPDRLKFLKSKITVGMKVDYFCYDRNKLIECVVLQVKRSRVSVEETLSGQKWTLPFYFLNLDNVETEVISNKATGMSKAELAIGDTVGFISTRDNQEYVGQVIKLNPKRAVIAINQESWTVPYAMLFPVLTLVAEETNQTILLADRHS